MNSRLAVIAICLTIVVGPIVIGSIPVKATSHIPLSGTASNSDTGVTDRSGAFVIQSNERQTGTNQRLTDNLFLSRTGVEAPTSSTSGSSSELESETVCVEHADDSGPPDPTNDVLGWEDGCWYNESIPVERSDGLNESELNAVVSRAMARVEQVREIEFQDRIPVTILPRSEFAENISSRYENVSARERLFHNVMAEARFFAGDDTDWISVLRELNTGGIGGFYSPTQDRIVVISENTTAPKLDEITLAQELYHALQDQAFDAYEDYLSRFANGTMTVEEHNRFDAVFEGDGNFVDHLYQQRCDMEWECLRPEETGPPPTYSPGEFGAIVTFLAPYSEGVGFVRDVYEEGGWEAVNALYDDPVKSTEQIIHTEKYGVDEPTTVTVPDTSSEPWQRLHPPRNGSVGGFPAQNASYGSFGEAGIFAMFFVVSYEEGSHTIVKWNDFFTDDEVDPYDYDSPVTAGWDGDRLVPYVKGEPTTDAETGYVWKTEWDTAGDATEFREAYVELLEYRGAEAVEGHLDTYRISQNERFSGAFYVVQNETSVIVVHAPSVEGLSAIRSGAAPEGNETTPTATSSPEEDPQTTETEEEESVDEEDGETATAADSPGMTILVGLVAVTLLPVVLRRRFDRH